ncbi:MAG TPA: hypothetical protein VF622_06695 [Segetibacter sp.]|jgi:hypothetical protein
MERVGILINKLQEQLNQQADAKSMLVTVQMLNAELMQNLQQKNGHSASKVSVVMPNNYAAAATEGMPVSEKIILESIQPIKQQEEVETISLVPELVPVETINETKIQGPIKVEEPVKETPVKREHSSWIFDPIEAPTLAHQEKIVYELNVSMSGEEPTVNDKLKTNNAEVAHILHEVPIKDLKKAISINDRHRFIEDLFRGDETMYERSIKTINNFNNYAEAEFWMQRELKLKLAWDNNSTQVKLFDQLVRRRFS